MFVCPAGTNPAAARLWADHFKKTEGTSVNSIIYLVGLVVVVIAILSFVGLA